MVESAQFAEPKKLFDEIVAASERNEDSRSIRPLLQKCVPWLLLFGQNRPFQVETTTMPRDWFLDCLNDGSLLAHVTMKPWEQITDDMRVRHSRRVLEEWAEETLLHMYARLEKKEAVIHYDYLLRV